MATQSQLYSALVAVGMSADRAKVGAAIGMAESGGNVRAHNAVPPDNSYGVWQINMIGALGPARRTAYGLSSNDDLYDLATNARVAKAISHNGANWRPWSTYTSGSYKKYLSNSISGSATVEDASLLDDYLNGMKLPFSLSSGNPFKDFYAVTDAVRKTAAWVSNSQNWIRVAYVSGGMVVVLVGLNMLVRSTGPGAAAAKVVDRGTAVAKVAVTKKLK